MTGSKSPGVCQHCGAAQMFTGQSICHKCARPIADPARSIRPATSGSTSEPGSGAAWQPEPWKPSTRGSTAGTPGKSGRAIGSPSSPPASQQTPWHGDQTPWYRDGTPARSRPSTRNAPVRFAAAGVIAIGAIVGLGLLTSAAGPDPGLPVEATDTPVRTAVLITPWASTPSAVSSEPFSRTPEASPSAGSSAGPTSPPLAFPGVDPFTSTPGHLDRARAYHTATLLPDGRVAIIGGRASNVTWGALVTIELYDPGLGVFELAGRLVDARYDHTATLLADGRVLVAGGIGLDGVPIASAEVYDPETHQSVMVGAMAHARRSASAVRLPNGKVAIVGGSGSKGVVDVPETFDPATGEFEAGEPPLAHEPAPIAVDRSGHILLAGVSADGSREVVAMYRSGDPTFSQAVTITTGRPGRVMASSCLLANGRLLVVGGKTAQGASGTIEAIDPGDYEGILTGDADVSLITPRIAPSVTELGDGSVLIVGGTDGRGTPIPTVERWAAGSPGATAVGSMAAARDGHTATLLEDGTVLIVGGRTEYGMFLATAGIFAVWQPHPSAAAGDALAPALTSMERT